MDKARELKRGGRRFSPARQRQLKASGSALNGSSDLEFSERSKKERVRGSRGSCRATSSNEDSEMGGGGASEEEEEIRLPSSSNCRRFKLNGKAFDDCGPVDPASVPRKLRSAMSKRNRESISPPFPNAKKRCHTSNETELPQVNGTRRSKQSMKGGFDKPLKQPMSMTKDEEEVAEALYALAGISADSELATSNVESITAKDEPSHLPVTAANSIPPKEGLKEESTKPPYASTGTEVSSLSLCQEEQLPEESDKVEPANEPSVPEGPALTGSQKLNLELNSPQADLQTFDSLSKFEQAENTHSSCLANLSNPIQSQSCVEKGILHMTQLETFPEGKPEENGSFLEVKPGKESIENAACHATMEDLQHGMPNGISGSHQNLMRSSSLQSGACLESITCATRPPSTGNDVLAIKLPFPSVRRSHSYRRCANHIYICHFIRDYKSTENKSKSALPNNCTKPSEGTRSGVLGARDSASLKNDLNKIMPAGVNCLATDRNSLQETRIGIMQENRFLQEQQSSKASGTYALHKQTCDFLSLSSGCESSNSGNGLESSAQLQVPYLHPLVQHPVIPFSLQHARYSSAHPDQGAAVAAVAAQQAQLQLPPHYMANPFYGQQVGPGGGLTKQHQQQQHHQQHMWAARSQMAHCRPPGFPSSNNAKWQSGRQDSLSIVPCAQSTIHTSQPSLELLGAKYTPGPQQLFSIPASRPKRQMTQHLPSNYDDGSGGSGNGAVFRSDGPQPLQLLCNAQHM